MAVTAWAGARQGRESGAASGSPTGVAEARTLEPEPLSAASQDVLISRELG